MYHKEQRSDTMKRWMLNVLIVIFAAIFLVSGYFLVDYLLESKKTADLYNDLASMVDKATQPTVWLFSS